MFADVTNDMTMARQEIFGSVLVAIRFDDDAEPIAMTREPVRTVTAALENSCSPKTSCAS